MALTLSQRITLLRDCYDVSELSSIWIDGNEITGYFTYTFVNSKTVNKKPVRSKGGSIKNINSYSFFITPRVKIFFNYLSLESYKIIMRLIQSKMEFTVRLFDIEQGQMVEHKMYISTEDYPELAFGYGKLRGIKGYTLELQGTNNDLSTIKVVYHLNKPEGTTSAVTDVETASFTSGTGILIGDGASAIKNETFSNTYTFAAWSMSNEPIYANNKGFKYIDGQVYVINGQSDLHLYATWTQGG